MKKGPILFAVTIIIFLCGLSSKFWIYDEEDYIKNEILDKATPFSVTIDIEYLRSLDPAYE